MQLERNPDVNLSHMNMPGEAGKKKVAETTRGRTLKTAHHRL